MTKKITIKRFHFDEVVVPAKPGVIDSAGMRKPLHMLPVGGKREWSMQFDELPKLILKLELSDGTVGYGEFYRDHNWTLVSEVAESLLGRDIRTICLQDLPIPLCREYDGFECAIWDAYAKSLGVPLYMLLGGVVRDRVYVGAWSSHRTVEEAGLVAKNYAEQGYDCIKFKCDLEDDVVGWCEQIKHHAPGMKVIFDPNQRWENSGEARRRLRGLEAVGNVLLLEDPICKWMLRDYAELRNFTTIPIVQHVSLPYVYQGQRVHDAISVIEHNAVDGFNFNAGLAKFRQLDAIASAARKNCWHGSEADLGILESMYLHQSIAAKSCVWPGDIFGRMLRSHCLLKSPIRFDPPYAFVPDEGPGLGIELDEEAIAEHRVSTTTVE
ncbi:mandelate racemase/muconate lactonizing enzyme family protein [Microbulbifer elongatus]|uniref:mandelate racemase/muconate lactonizing enzyme family protein n=1 Tax=Microbulbifer elongatus TaxID=86173 RepID=UPI001CFD3A52|nr:mandelate racemase/muconate lactonizing enzyme family protein [Microbulbifer elongatus]